jgi:hypothetical protein
MSRRRSYRPWLVIPVLQLLAAGCLADPQQVQSVDLLDRLATARSVLSAPSPNLEDGCTAVGDAHTRLAGEPGLSERQRAWAALVDATQALQAVCGQGTLLAQPSSGSPALTLARQRWADGIQRELRVTCDHLRVAADALNRPPPC